MRKFGFLFLMLAGVVNAQSWGGNFGHLLTFDNNVQIENTGGIQTDFFVGKFSTQACSPLAIDDHEMENFEVWPNPFSGILHVKSESGGKYMLYDLRGGVLAKGILRGGEARSISARSPKAFISLLAKITAASGKR
jgi:hypothetical protein